MQKFEGFFSHLPHVLLSVHLFNFPLLLQPDFLCFFSPNDREDGCLQIPEFYSLQFEPLKTNHLCLVSQGRVEMAIVKLGVHLWTKPCDHELMSGSGSGLHPCLHGSRDRYMITKGLFPWKVYTCEKWGNKKINLYAK